jgi:hypothetical protein
MFGDEAEFPCNVILLAFLRLANRQWMEAIIENLHIILRSTYIASIRRNRQSRFDLFSSDNNSLENYQIPNH